MDFLTNAEWLKQLGDHIRAQRLGVNMTQQTLAERSGISLKAVRNLEGGANSSTLSLVAVCKTLGKMDWVAALAPSAMTRDDFERYLRGGTAKRKRASGHV